jgi:hypothetical protein
VWLRAGGGRSPPGPSPPSNFLRVNRSTNLCAALACLPGLVGSSQTGGSARPVSHSWQMAKLCFFVTESFLHNIDSIAFLDDEGLETAKISGLLVEPGT